MSFVQMPERALHAHARLIAAAETAGERLPCRQDPEAWYGEGRGAAAALCAGCPALEPCAEYADTAGERWGVWGGKDRQGRKP